MSTGSELTARLFKLIAAKEANPADPAVEEAALSLAIETLGEFWDRQVRIEDLLQQLAFYAQNTEERARR